METALDVETILRNKQEFSRSDISKLLEIFNELLPDWNWLLSPAVRFDPNHESRIYFLHDNPLSDAFDKEILIEESMLRKMLYHSLQMQSALALMTTTGEEEDVSEIARLYYTLGAAECLLISYRDWARLYSSDIEYTRINSHVVNYFI